MVDAKYVHRGDQITYSEACLYIRNKKGLHSAMELAAWVLPSVNSPLITMDWLQEVRDGTIWCPKTNELTLGARCFSNPPKDLLLTKVYACIKRACRTK